MRCDLGKSPTMHGIMSSFVKSYPDDGQIGEEIAKRYRLNRDRGARAEGATERGVDLLKNKVMCVVGGDSYSRTEQQQHFNNCNAYLLQYSTFGRSTGMTLFVALSQAVLNTSQFMIVQVRPIKVCRS